MPPAGCSIRFVGGPWHNQFGPVGTLTIISPGGLYRLAEFHTPRFKTKYYQYIHQSLIYSSGVVAKSTYIETLPVKPINSRQLYFRLRKAVKCQRT